MLGALVIAFLACSLWAAGLVICPKCGTEADGSATVCAHCGALLPAARSENVVPTNTAVSAEKRALTISDMALEAARTDKRLADECVAKRPELAYSFEENALALSRLVSREGMSVDAGKTLAENLERCRKLLAYATRPCPSCNGGGKRTVQFQSLSGDKSTQANASMQISDGLTCPTCGGRGVVSAGRSADELRILIAQGRRDFETRQQALGRIACGRVWVPQELLALLDVKAQALIRTACPTPCPGCMGIGMQDCPHCKGAGRLKCTNEGCVNGLITVKESNTLAPKSAISRKERCPVCSGSGFMPCTDCRGVGTVPCKLCNGTGRNAVCQECGGQGWGVCTKCQGTGSVGGAPCPDCHGKGDRLCPKCHGEGCAVR